MRRLTYLQGLRGLAAMIVLVHHFAANFYPATISAHEGMPHGDWEHWFWQTPLGILLAGHAAVCLFFILSGYVLSLPYFGAAGSGPDHLLAAMVKRPPRLLAMVAASMLISYFVFRLHGYFNQPAAELTGSTQLAYYFKALPSPATFAKNFLLDPFGTASSYDPPLWTILHELLGSYVTFVFVLLFRGARYRGWVYLVLAAALSTYPILGFVIGIALADACVNFPSTVRKYRDGWISVAILLGGVYFAAYPFWAPLGDLAFSWYARLPHFLIPDLYPLIGASLLLCGVILNSPFQRLLSGAILLFLGRISYAVYAIHFLVIFSFSSWLFLCLREVCGYDGSAALVFLASLAVVGLLAFFLTVCVDEVAIKVSNDLAKRWLLSRTAAGPEGKTETNAAVLGGEKSP
jgi:peptidoglycan/LPS O-acetylase OafA/YrhL